MYTDEDLDVAVKAGIFSQQSVKKFRVHMGSVRNMSSVDDENFRLLTGFNDIFVVIASLLLLISATWVAGALNNVFGPIVLSLLSWGLTEFFVLKRRMALPAIVLLLSFLGGIFAIPLALSANPHETTFIFSGLLTAFAA
jgi:hypothetical protein